MNPIEESKHQLDDLKGICNYRGCEVTKLIGVGYSIWGIKCATPEEVDLQIERASSIINESIPDRSTFTVKADNGGNVAINDFKDSVRSEYSWDKESGQPEENKA